MRGSGRAWGHPHRHAHYFEREGMCGRDRHGRCTSINLLSRVTKIFLKLCPSFSVSGAKFETEASCLDVKHSESTTVGDSNEDE